MLVHFQTGDCHVILNLSVNLKESRVKEMAQYKVELITWHGTRREHLEVYKIPILPFRETTNAILHDYVAFVQSIYFLFHVLSFVFSILTFALTTVSPIWPKKVQSLGTFETFTSFNPRTTLNQSILIFSLRRKEAAKFSYHSRSCYWIKNTSQTLLIIIKSALKR